MNECCMVFPSCARISCLWASLKRAAFANDCNWCKFKFYVASIYIRQKILWSVYCSFKKLLLPLLSLPQISRSAFQVCLCSKMECRSSFLSCYVSANVTYFQIIWFVLNTCEMWCYSLLYVNRMWLRYVTGVGAILVPLKRPIVVVLLRLCLGYSCNV